MPSAARVSVVVVLYNSADVLEDCLLSVPREAELIVVDNASTDDGAMLAQRVRPDARVIRSPTNQGFGAGCNIGAKNAHRAVVVFLNPDARLHPGAVERMVDAVDQPGTGLVGPVLIGGDGYRLLTCRRWSTLAQDFVESLPGGVRWAPARLRRDLPVDAPVYTTGGGAAYTTGACMAISRVRLEEIGSFDEDLFLYGEEESVALRFLGLGLHSVLVPDAIVSHIGGTSTAKAGHVSAYHLKRSRVVLHRKHTGNRVSAITVLTAAALVRLLVTVVYLVLGRDRRETPSSDLAALRGVLSGAVASLSETPSYPRA